MHRRTSRGSAGAAVRHSLAIGSIGWLSTTLYSRFGEAIRGLAIRLRAPHGGDAKVMLMTSAVAGEGASTVAANIARVMARSGVKTLLIQADVRHTAAPGAPPGLYEALRDGTSPLTLLRRESDSGLVLLPAGRINDPGRGSELLTGHAMERVLEALRPKFDHIVIDATPILSSVDSRSLLDLSDEALLVVAWDKTRRVSLEAAVDSVGLNADKFRGIVLNCVDFALYATHDDMPQMASSPLAA